jgi:hypothetical protein
MSAYQTFGPLFEKTLENDGELRARFLGKTLRDQGIKQVSEHNENWMERAIKSACQYLHYGWYGEDFTGEDIRLACEMEVGSPKHSNAFGALINILIKRKIIVPTGEYRAMKDSSSHARKTPVYKAT